LALLRSAASAVGIGSNYELRQILEVEMKVLGLDKSNGVIVHLSYGEWRALGGAEDESGRYGKPDISKAPDVMQIARALRAIRSATPNLQQIRSVFQSFLMLTEPAAVQEELSRCGVAEPFVEPECATDDSSE
jgi:hypothetical protein